MRLFDVCDMIVKVIVGLASKLSTNLINTFSQHRTKQYPKSISQPRSVFVKGMAGARR